MRKKSIKKAQEIFAEDLAKIDRFLLASKALPTGYSAWAYDYAVIRLYRAFENFVLSALVAAVNNDTSQLSARTEVKFPKHLTDEVCEYLIVGDGYFDFKGRDGLIKTIKGFVADNHYLLTAVKKDIYRDALERLSALRNFAAHDSWPSKKRALKAIGGSNISSSGAWLSKQNRFAAMSAKLCDLTQEIASAAPY